MYNDYPTVYETVTNDNIIYVVIISIFILLILALIFLSLGKIYKKANRSFISALIPIYNLSMLLEIVNMSKWYIVLFFIPIINIFVGIKVYFVLAQLFRKTKWFALGMLFLPFVFLPILAFGNSEYIGINLMAIEGKTQAADIPTIIHEEDKNPIVHEEEDVKSKNIGISIGGGVYQKEYTNTLLQVDKNQEIINNKIPTNDLNGGKKIPTLDLSKTSFITQIKEEPLKEEEPNMVGIKFPEPLSRSNSIDSMSHNENNIVNQIKNIELSNSNNNIKQEINSQFIKCPKCGTNLKSDSKVCFLCGCKLD